MASQQGWHARFMRVVTIWTTLSHLPWAVAVALALRPYLGAGAWVAFVVAWVAPVLALRPMVDATLPDWPRPQWRVHGLERPYLVHWSAVHPVWLGWVVGILAWAAGFGEPWWWALGAYAVAWMALAWGAYVNTIRLRVRTLDLPIPELHRVFDGYRIMHLSDLHVGSFAPPHRLAQWIDRARRQAADLAVITGDFITSGVAFHDAVAEQVGRLHNPDGVVAVPGNHDYFGDGQPMFRQLENRGVRVLRNEHLVIERGGQRLIIAGVDDAWTGRTDLQKALRDRPTGTTVLLAHDPALFDLAADSGAALVLSGHTHGGQLAVPGLARWINLTKLSNRYSLGVYRRNRSTLVVSAGMGCTGLPIRIGVPPEILVLQLRCA